jgi:hypothetical protein
MAAWSERWADRRCTWCVVEHRSIGTGTVIQDVERPLEDIGEFPLDVARHIVAEHNARVAEIFTRVEE